MIPAWLQPILEAKGVLNVDGVSRRARAGICHSCGRTVLRGLDADWAALAATVDPEPLNRLGEFLALSVGRRTYDLSWRGRYELDPREPAHIRERPADVYGKSAVVVLHSCKDRMPIEGQVVELNETKVQEDKCPF